MNKQNLQEYAQLKKLEKETATRLEELKPLIVEDMRAEDVDKIEVTDVGNFILSSQSRWTYSKAVEDLQEKEKANGTAKQTTSTVLRFTGLK